MQGGRSRQDRGAVRCIRHGGGHIQAHHGQTAVDKTHEQAGEHARTRDLAREARIIGHAELADIRRDDDAEGERRKQVHGLIARLKTRHDRIALIRAVRRTDGVHGIEQRSAHHGHDQHDKRGTGDAPQQLGERTGVHGQQVGHGKERHREHKARHFERNAGRKQRLQHLKRGRRGARNGQARSDREVDGGDEHTREHRVHTRGEVANRTGKADGDDAEHGQADSGDEKTDHGGYDGAARLQAEKGRDNEVARPEEHREQGDAHEQGLSGREFCARHVRLPPDRRFCNGGNCIRVECLSARRV